MLNNRSALQRSDDDEEELLADSRRISERRLIASDNDSDDESLRYIPDTSDQDFHYTLLQGLGQFAGDLAAAGSIMAVANELFPLPQPYLLMPVGYKIVIDGIELSRSLFDTANPIHIAQELGCSVFAKKWCLKLLSGTMVFSTGAVAREMLSESTDTSNHLHNEAPPSIHDAMAIMPVVSIIAVLLGKGVEWGGDKLSSLCAEQVQVPLERNPELKAWQLGGGYVVKSIQIAAEAGTVFLYMAYAGAGDSLNQTTQTLETLGAIAFFQFWERMCFVPRPFMAMKCEPMPIQLPRAQYDELPRVYTPMTNREIAFEAGKNALRETFSLSLTYMIVDLYFSYLLPEMHQSESFAPQEDEQAIYARQVLGASVTTGSYFAAKAFCDAAPSIAASIVSGAKTMAGWATFFCRRQAADAVIQLEADSDIEQAPQNLVRPN